MMCERCEELEEENTELRRQLTYEVDADLWRAIKDRLSLTPQQAIVVAALCQAKGRLVSRASLALLLPTVRRLERESDQIIDVHVVNLRKKLGAGAIETVWGRGYRAGAMLFDMCAASSASALT